ncbi:MAG: ABC-F family ATP-binding cassette domain-containing protein, partial [Spirochaetaceae bacterium]|nr:ABC-F family ATP-binding cassette domain-containing protein [Spirochaetaceae bacterium]
VSHDRYFLDQTVNEIYELFLGNLTRYKGNYSKYEKTRAVELESLYQKYKTQQDEIEKIEDFIRKFRYKPTKAAQVQERIKMLEKMVKIEIPENMKRVRFSFPEAPHSGEIVLTAKNLCKNYGEKSVLRSLDLQLTRGMRLNVAGKNGAGKTTLLRILGGNDQDFSGEIKIGSGVSIGFFSQENVESMDGDATCLEIIEEVAPFDMQPKVRSLLGAFLFRGDDVFKAVKVLSGGEKSRLAILQLLLRPHNLLILDEPTNHLDISAQEVLKEALADFGGTVIFVSHDRDFSAAIANGVLDLNGDFPVMYPGNYEYFLSQTEGTDKKAETPVTENSQPRQKAQQRLSWEEAKRAKAERRSLERREEQLLEEIGGEEEKLALLRERQNLPEIYGDLEKARQIHKEIEETEEKINSLQEEWERVSLELENFSEKC